MGKDDADYIDFVKQAMLKPEKETVLGDCLDEHVLSELPMEEKGDYEDVMKEIANKKKEGWSRAEQKWHEATKKKKPKSKAKPKSKGKAKCKAKAKCRGRVPPDTVKRLAEQAMLEDNQEAA